MIAFDLRLGLDWVFKVPIGIDKIASTLILSIFGLKVISIFFCNMNDERKQEINDPWRCEAKTKREKESFIKSTRRGLLLVFPEYQESRSNNNMYKSCTWNARCLFLKVL